MRGTAVWFALNARLAKLRPYSIALFFSQAQRKIAETSASGVQDKLADGAAILRERRERLEARVTNNSARRVLTCSRASYA
jgi:hypothetical protein